MARKIKPPEELPSKAWLMSFGDTMTTLLAFFIVLCSMAENQTGANLHTGTGSFLRHLERGGVAGAFSGDMSKNSIQHQATSPLYMVGEEDEAASDNKGPDDEENVISKDYEQESFVRCINELESWAEMSPQPAVEGDVAYDFFKKLNAEPPHLPENFDQIAVRIAPILRRSNFRGEVVVWAATPSDSARRRGIKQSGAIAKELSARASLSDKDANRIVGVCRNWPHADIKRPVITIILKRLAKTP